MIKKNIVRLITFPFIFIYMELAFHVYSFSGIDENIIYPILFAVAYGLLIAFFSSFWSEKWNRIIAIMLQSMITVFYLVQIVYGHVFKTYLTLNSVGHNAGAILEFWDQTINGIISSIPGILLILLGPAALIFLLKKKWLSLTKLTMLHSFHLAGFALITYLLTLIIIPNTGKSAHKAYDLYYDNWVLDLGIEKLGVLTSVSFDVIMVLSGKDAVELIEEPVFVAIPDEDVQQEMLTETPIPTVVVPLPSVKVTPTPSLAPEPTVLSTSPNILDIDFGTLAKEETDENVKAIHEYMRDAIPTNKNEYTGMFQGYNLIMLTAEGFSPLAVDEKVTPTLFRLVNEGFVFNNFYTPIWYTSTSDGEYVACTGQIPYSTNSFSRSAQNAMPFAFGHRFSSLGYITKAWHNHTYTYYNRDASHPNMGYEFKAKDNGLDITPSWPESDLEMLKLTVPEYIHEDNFHVYYMTVSGHMEYDFEGNAMSYKNRKAVKNLPYSKESKAYIACNKELDRALAYLIKQLTKAGIADKTVIALSADHYPYGLKKEQMDELAGHEIEENFELYKNNFVIWSASMKEPVIVDKYSSSLDIMPTLCNLFGLEYDSRLYAGQDILSDAQSLVIFSNQSFISDKGMYNSKTGDMTSFSGEEISEEYIETMNEVVKNKFRLSANILLEDYYSYLLPYLSWIKK